MQCGGRVDAVRFENASADSSVERVAVSTSCTTGDTWDGTIRVVLARDVSAPNNSTLSQTVACGVPDLAWIPTAEGNRVVSAHDDGTWAVWTATSGVLHNQCEDDSARTDCHDDAVLALAVHAPSARLLTASSDRAIKLWTPLESLTSVQTLVGHTGPVTDVAWSSPTSCVSVSQDRSLRVWDLAANTATSAFSSDVRLTAVDSCAHDPTLVVVGTEDGHVHVFDLRNTRQPLASRAAHAVHVTSVGFVPAAWGTTGGIAVISGSDDCTVAVHGGDGLALQRFRYKHEATVASFSCSTVQKGVFVSGSWDGTVAHHTLDS